MTGPTMTCANNAPQKISSDEQPCVVRQEQLIGLTSFLLSYTLSSFLSFKEFFKLSGVCSSWYYQKLNPSATTRVSIDFNDQTIKRITTMPVEFQQNLSSFLSNFAGALNVNVTTKQNKDVALSILQNISSVKELTLNLSSVDEDDTQKLNTLNTVLFMIRNTQNTLQSLHLGVSVPAHLIDIETLKQSEKLQLRNLDTVTFGSDINIWLNILECLNVNNVTVAGVTTPEHYKTMVSYLQKVSGRLRFLTVKPSLFTVPKASSIRSAPSITKSDTIGLPLQISFPLLQQCVFEDETIGNLLISMLHMPSLRSIYVTFPCKDAVVSSYLDAGKTSTLISIGTPFPCDNKSPLNKEPPLLPLISCKSRELPHLQSLHTVGQLTDTVSSLNYSAPQMKQLKVCKIKDFRHWKAIESLLNENKDHLEEIVLNREGNLARDDAITETEELNVIKLPSVTSISVNCGRCFQNLPGLVCPKMRTIEIHPRQKGQLTKLDGWDLLFKHSPEIETVKVYGELSFPKQPLLLPSASQLVIDTQNNDKPDAYFCPVFVLRRCFDTPKLEVLHMHQRRVDFCSVAAYCQQAQFPLRKIKMGGFQFVEARVDFTGADFARRVGLQWIGSHPTLKEIEFQFLEGLSHEFLTTFQRYGFDLNQNWDGLEQNLGCNYSYRRTETVVPGNLQIVTVQEMMNKHAKKKKVPTATLR